MDNDKLSSLITESGIKACRFDDGHYLVTFIGRLRPYDVSIWMGNGWICSRVQLLPLPTAHSLRSAAMSAALAINDKVSLVKIVLAWDTILCVDMEYRVEHVDGAALANLVGLVQRVAEEHYPRLMEIASGSDTLDALEAAFDRSPGAQ